MDALEDVKNIYGKPLKAERRAAVREERFKVRSKIDECFDFAYESGTCDPARPLNFEDFRQVDDNSLDPFDAITRPSSPIRVTGSDGNIRFQVRLNRQETVMEATPKESQNRQLLDHERIHWEIACHLAQLANVALENGETEQDVHHVLARLWGPLQDMYDDQAYKKRESTFTGSMAQQEWDLNWCRTVAGQFRKTLRERKGEE